MIIGIVDYGMGNLRSVANAFESLGCTTVVATKPAELCSVDRIVLPGVGAFGDGINNLRKGGWIPALEEQVKHTEKPFLGLCVGMQLLASKGTEHGDHEGLGWVPGIVRRLTPSDPSIRVPHIGWNDVEIAKHDGLYREANGQQTFYFVHSYAFHPKDPSVVSGWCNHGERFAASLETKNIFAAQYHPEKSQKCGIAVLQNFLRV
jgi:glutamine amidotransferase